MLAVIGGNLTDVLPACLKRAGTLYLHGGVLIGDDLAFLRTYSNQLLLGTMAQDRYLADMLQSLRSLLRVWVERGVRTHDASATAYREHREVFEALRDRDPSRADALMAPTASSTANSVATKRLT